MRQDLEKFYESCEECKTHCNSRPQKDNEISMTSLFENFFPNQRVQIDCAEKGMDNYLVMCDVMSGFFQVYCVPKKSAEQAILKVREWSSFWRKPFEILADGGPGFRKLSKKRLPSLVS